MLDTQIDSAGTYISVRPGVWWRPQRAIEWVLGSRCAESPNIPLGIPQGGYLSECGVWLGVIT